MMKQDSFILIWIEDLCIKNSINSQADMVFENLDLRVDSGEYAAVSGIYGTDRINFINVLGCIKKPSSGKYIFDYNDITTIEPARLDDIRSKSIGFVFKGLNIIDSLSVYKNIELPLLRYIDKDSSKDIEHAAERFGLKEVLHKKARELSDLDRQKVALARALVAKPALIIADEPGEGLSSTDASNVMDLINEINKDGTAVIVFSDKAEIIESAERHITFENGKIKADNRLKNSSVREGVV